MVLPTEQIVVKLAPSLWTQRLNMDVNNALVRAFPGKLVNVSMSSEFDIEEFRYTVTSLRSVHQQACEVVEDVLDGFPSVVTGSSGRVWEEEKDVLKAD